MSAFTYQRDLIWHLRDPTGGTAGTPALVSVIIPSRNYACYVGQAIRSALHQGYRWVEVVVVDDGSTDGTAAVLQEFDGTIRVVRLDGRGVSVARNVGLAHASGDYVVFLDADDLLVPGGMAAQVARLTRCPSVDVVSGAWYVCDLELGTATLHRGNGADREVLSELLRANILGTPSAVMLRRGPLEEAGGFDPSFAFAADWELWLRLAKRGHRFARVEVPVAIYRIHGRSMTRSLDRAIDDVTGLVERSFRDTALPEAMRLAEPHARFAVLKGLAELCLEQGDTRRGADCLREALRWKPDAVDTLELYRNLAGAMSRYVRVGRRPVGGEITALLNLMSACGGDPDRGSSRRRALSHLAAAMLARSAGAGGLGLWHLRVAIRESWRTVLAPAALTTVLRLLLPRWLTRPAGGVLARVRMRGAGIRQTPAVVRTVLAGDAGRGP